MFKNVYILLTAILFLVISNLKAAKEVTAASSFQPSTLAVDTPGLLNITIEGVQGNIIPSIPSVEGLTFQYLGTQNSIHSNNGKISISHVFSFTVVGQKIGEFTLPSFDIEIDGKKYPVASSKLTVTDKIADNPKEDLAISLDLHVENKQVYLGQMVPLTVTLSLPLNIGVQSGPLQHVSNDYFNFSNFRKQTNIKSLVNGVPKHVYSVLTYVTPIKTGEKELQYTIDLLIQRPRSNRRSRSLQNLVDPFDSHLDAWLDNLMGSAEQIEVLSSPLNLSIVPLPQNNKPNDFTGAIGQFTLENFSLTPTESAVGDPMTLKMEIKGSGNFDRISPPTLPNTSDWKTYPPKSGFKPNEEENNFSGIKTFEYVIIPQSEFITKSPEISFNYFDPELNQYKVITPETIPLKITPSTVPTSTFPSQTLIKQSTASPNTLNQPQLLPIKLEITHSIKSLTPLIAKKLFILYALLIVVVISMSFFIYKKMTSKMKNDKLYIKEINTQKAIHNNLQKVRKAYAKEDSIAFYEGATAVTLEMVSLQHSKTAHALTLHDVIEYFNEKGLSEDHLTFLKHLFHTADMLKFSGTVINHKLTPETLQKFEFLHHELEK